MQLQGANTALITPFDHEGEIDFDALTALVERQIEGGIDGLVPCGTTGEASTMTLDEQMSVIKRVVDVAGGDVPIIAGTGSNNTKQTVEYTQAVAEIRGVDAALVVTPYYNKPSQRGLIQHFETVAQHGKLPVVLYNVPGRTSISMTAETIAELAKNPNIIAIKEATGDMVLGSRIKELARDFTLLSGDDFTTMPLMSVGGVGCVSVVSNIIPGIMSRMCLEMNEGNVANARAIHLKIQAFCRAMFSDTNPVPVKSAARHLGWCDGTVRGPLMAPTEEIENSIQQVLKDYELI